mmetsp:Transcript_59017/g.175586  ORF Transcript_59017/g.175586 Transcript_59017/m.175586 type:complete len:330 (-) Transcript_59017:80-1069(-)
MLSLPARPLQRLSRCRGFATGFPEARHIWHNGRLIPWRDANVHILSTAVQFGCSLFEGMRCYATPRGPAIVHLWGHLRRLLDSCKMYRIEVPYSAEELARACFEVVHGNGLVNGCYVRPMVLRGYGAPGMDGIGSPVETYVPAWEWGAYLGADAFSTGISCCTSSWSRPAPNTFPGMAKAAGNYMNAQLIKLEAQSNGFVEAVALGTDGMVSEGSGQNLFLVRDGELVTPPINGSNLQGLTRRSVMELAREEGLTVRVEPIPREALYVADELFYTGTATEVMPIRSLDHITIGEGGRGPITALLQKRYQDVIHGRAEDRHGWLSWGPDE